MVLELTLTIPSIEWGISMRRCNLPIGEDYVAYYYGLKKSGIENGKVVYEFDKEPIKFHFKQTSITGSAVFTSSKGFERKNQVLGNTMMTEYSLFRIQTSDSWVGFNINGLIKMKIDNQLKSFTIVKLTTLGTGVYSKTLNRNGSFDTSKAPLVIELN